MYRPTLSKIEWCDMVLNICVGCLNNCSRRVFVESKGIDVELPYCYARLQMKRYYKQFAKQAGITDLGDIEKLKNFQPFCYPNRLKVKYPKKPKVIFVDSMSDWKYWTSEAKGVVIADALDHPQHQFVILTKCLNAYDDLPGIILPENLWLGFSAQSGDDLIRYMINHRPGISGGRHLLNLEPFVSIHYTERFLHGWDRVIVGGMTGWKSLTTAFRSNFSEDHFGGLLENCTALNIPVFIKPNIWIYANMTDYLEYLTTKNDFWDGSSVESVRKLSEIKRSCYGCITR